MKKVIITIVALLSLTIMKAQEDKVRFGIKGGINLSTLTGNEFDFIAENFESKLGFHIGALIEIPVSEKWAIQPELLFSIQGTQDSLIFSIRDENGVLLGENDGAKFNYNYLNVPILFKYYLARGFSLQGGPQLGFLLSAKLKGGFNESESLDLEDNSFLDFGFNVGVGYQLGSDIFFNANYNMGLTNVVDNDLTDVNRQNRVFQVSVGYKF